MALIPMVVIVFGLPASGKSYFAERLAKLLRADYINSDRLRRDLFQKRTYSDQEKAMVYNEMLKKMREANAQGKNLVLDATFHKRATRKPFVEAAVGDLFFIEVQADENLTQKRLRNDRPYSEADDEVFKLIRKQWEPIEQPYLILESTNENIDAMLLKATQYLNNDK